MIRRMIALTNPRGRRLLRLLLASVVVGAIVQGAAFVALVPFLSHLLAGERSAAQRWLVVLVGLAVLYGAAFWVGSQWGQQAATQVIESLLDRLGDRLVELPMGWFATDHSGEVADTATRGVIFASGAPYAILRPILTAFITPATVLVGTFFIDWRVAVTMAGAGPVLGLTYRWLTGRVTRADRAHVEAVGAASTRLIEFARVQPALRAAGDNAITRGLLDRALAGQHAANRRMLLTGGAALGVFGVIVQLALLVVIVLGTSLALHRELAVATLVALLVLTVRFTEPITNGAALGGGIRVATNTLDGIQALLDQPTPPEPATPATPAAWDVRFDGVTFGYGGEPVLRELSFTAAAGRMTAIVGPSGSGKTTIIRLIARSFDPERGRVLIGGIPVPQLGTEAVLRAVAPVFQDVYLFDASILDNIWLGDPDATRDEVLRAGALARVDEIVARLPDGWDTRVGEGGTNLSGGERQRVSIARALLKDAPIVLLDEATAALDVGNEQAIQAAFAAIARDRTRIVVAHRLQTISSADTIIMLDGHGGIAERGTHQELLAAGGAYARYWSQRVKAAGWRLAGTDVDVDVDADRGGPRPGWQTAES